MESVDLSVVIVNWNSKEYVRRCIASILANTFGVKYEIVVVDSASFDGCSDMLRVIYPQVRFVQSERNEGFGRANNLGVGHSSGGVLLLLNPDTEVQRDSVAQLYNSVRALPKAGVVGCRLLNSDGSLQTSCVQPFPTIWNQTLNAAILQRWFPQVRLWVSADTYKDAVSPVPVEVVSGACMMIKREIFDRVGQFSNDYFMYGEDVDLCYKSRAAAFTNYHVPGAEIVHHGGGSTQGKHVRFATVMKHESVSRVLKKTRGLYYSQAYRVGLLGMSVVRLGILLSVLPFTSLIGTTRNCKAAIGKWISILRWSIGLEGWVKDYDER